MDIQCHEPLGTLTSGGVTSAVRRMLSYVRLTPDGILFCMSSNVRYLDRASASAWQEATRMLSDMSLGSAFAFTALMTMKLPSLVFHLGLSLSTSTKLPTLNSVMAVRSSRRDLMLSFE